jgi:hypothetical protein
MYLPNFAISKLRKSTKKFKNNKILVSPVQERKPNKYFVITHIILNLI